MAFGQPHVLKLVILGMQGHSACEMFLKKKMSYAIQIFSPYLDFSHVKVNLACLSCSVIVIFKVFALSLITFAVRVDLSEQGLCQGRQSCPPPMSKSGI